MIGMPLDYLRLTRASNLPTIATNILATSTTAGLAAAAIGHRWWLCFLAIACVYAAGMILNDLTDRFIDRYERPDRPIPSGRIALFLARLLAVILIGLAVALAGIHARSALPWLFLLIILVGLYNALPRKSFLGARVMSACRALIPIITCAWLGLAITPVVQILVITTFLYTEIITQLARHEANIPGRPQLVQLAIAGFCLHDAIWIFFAGEPTATVIAVLCALLTLLLHRLIPGS
ncbi:UbiA family prenyltransferase [Mucisphaera sp.]|uniref:UbiA family prenyltransferase n=1 Tax=Mucisphaera sp. TaxID=2913024 RepID=UPI003D12BA84